MLVLVAFLVGVGVGHYVSFASLRSIVAAEFAKVFAEIKAKQ